MNLRLDSSALRPPVLAVMGMFYFGLVLHASPRLSPAYDERIHVAAGLTMLDREAYASAKAGATSAIDPLTPPVDVVFAVMARLHGRSADPLVDPWGGFEHILFARWVAHVAGAVMLLLLFLWGESHWGLPGGVMAASSLMLNPLFIGHATIIGTDLLGALGALSFVFASWTGIAARPHELPALGRGWWLRAVAIGLTGAFAIVCKVTNVVFLIAPVIAMIVCVSALIDDDSASDEPFEPGLPSAWLKPVGFLLIVLGTAVLVGGVAYDMARRAMLHEIPGAASFMPVGKSLAHAILTASGMSGAPPRIYFMGGLESPSPLHFASAFMLKTPLPLMFIYFMTPLAAVLHVRHASPQAAPMKYMLLVAVCACVFFATRGLYLGLRHMLPVLPLLCGASGGVAALPALFSRREGFREGDRSPLVPLGVILLVWCVGIVILNAPWHLGYFNPIARGRMCLVDADGDWGEGLLALREWRSAHPEGDLFLSYFGNNRPELFDVEYRGLLSPYAPVYNDPELAAEVDPGRLDGFVAISITQMAGVYFERTGQPSDHYARWFTRKPDWIIAGGAIRIFDCRKQGSGVERGG